MEHNVAILLYKKIPEQNGSHLRCGCLYLKHFLIPQMQVSIKNIWNNINTKTLVLISGASSPPPLITVTTLVQNMDYVWLTAGLVHQLKKDRLKKAKGN